MNPVEYEKLAAIDSEHWFYRGKRDIVRYWIARFRPLSSDDLLIDVGCGTGALLAEMSGTCRVLGLDNHEESAALVRDRLGKSGTVLVKSSICEASLPEKQAAVVTALDVLEHIQDDATALRNIIQLAEPGGLIILTVPAMRWLWSDWDVSLQHYRRYERPDFMRLLETPHAEILHCAYFNTLALAPMLLIRLVRRWFPPAPGQERAEDRVPPRWLNSLLHATLVWPATWKWMKPPLGGSLLAVLRRRPALA